MVSDILLSLALGTRWNPNHPSYVITWLFYNSTTNCKSFFAYFSTYISSKYNFFTKIIPSHSNSLKKPTKQPSIATSDLKMQKTPKIDKF